MYHFKWWNKPDLARSHEQEHIEKAQQLFSQFIEDEIYKERIMAFLAQKETYDKALEKVKQDIRDIIKSIELGNIIKGKCHYCP